MIGMVNIAQVCISVLCRCLLAFECATPTVSQKIHLGAMALG